jgi:hypothetical protein
MKYAMKCQPLYEHRKRVVAGAETVTHQEIAVGEEQNKKDDEDYERLPPLRASVIPRTPILEFWLRVLQTHPGFAQRINDDDKAALKYLMDVRITPPYQTSGPGFTVEFSFNRNPYFNNSALRKTFIYKVDRSFTHLSGLAFIFFVCRMSLISSAC